MILFPRVGWFTSCSFFGKSHCFSKSGALWVPVRELAWLLLVSLLPSSAILAASTVALALLCHSSPARGGRGELICPVLSPNRQENPTRLRTLQACLATV